MSLQNVNRSLFLDVNHFAKRTPELHGLFLFLANEGIVLFALLLLSVYLLVRLRKSLVDMAKVACTGLAAIVAVGLNQPLAHTFKELRPYDSLSNILVLIHRANDYSFPSDHGVMIGAVTAGLFLINPALGAISLVLGLLVAFARVYTAAHYPFDLVAGIFFGAAVTLLCYSLLRRPMILLLHWLEKTPLRMFLTRNHADESPSSHSSRQPKSKSGEAKG